MNSHERPEDEHYPPTVEHGAPSTAESETKMWAMIMHLSQLANAILPPAGIVAPIVIWQIKKDALPGLDEHGRIIANWFISFLIYTCIALAILMTIVGALVAIPMFWILGILCVAYPIIGSIKANDGVAWKYPGSFRFF